jgi:hypothetical protein
MDADIQAIIITHGQSLGLRRWWVGVSSCFLREVRYMSIPLTISYLLHLACPSVNADCVYRIVVISTCMDVSALRPTLAMAMAIREWSHGSPEENKVTCKCLLYKTGKKKKKEKKTSTMTSRTVNKSYRNIFALSDTDIGRYHTTHLRQTTQWQPHPINGTLTFKFIITGLGGGCLVLPIIEPPACIREYLRLRPLASSKPIVSHRRGLS